jgi:hypothetical protein
MPCYRPEPDICSIYSHGRQQEEGKLNISTSPHPHPGFFRKSRLKKGRKLPIYQVFFTLVKAYLNGLNVLVS